MCWAPEASLTWDIRLHPDHKHTNDRFIVTIHIFERVQPEHRSFLPFLKFQPGETKTFNLNHKITFLKPGFFAKINTISTIDPDFKLVIEEQIFDDNLFGFDDKQYNNQMRVKITNKSDDVFVVEKDTCIGEITIEPIPDFVDNSTETKKFINILSHLGNWQ